jgi:hypothetical protein
MTDNMIMRDMILVDQILRQQEEISHLLEEIEEYEPWRKLAEENKALKAEKAQWKTTEQQYGGTIKDLASKVVELRTILQEIVEDADGYTRRTGVKVSWVEKAREMLK